MDSVVLLVLIGLSAVLLIATVFLYVSLHKLRRRFDAALTTSNADTLEQLLADYHRRVGDVHGQLQDLSERHEGLRQLAGLASQKISVVRFNPFGDIGGDQSFALAVLDAHNSGYVITSMHGREGTRVYVKAVDYGESKNPLSSEEQQALQQAMKRSIDTRRQHG